MNTRKQDLMEPAGSTGATELDYEIFDSLLSPAMLGLEPGKQGGLRATYPAYLAVAMATPVVVFDNPSLRALMPQDAPMGTDGRVLLVDARWLRGLLDQVRDSRGTSDSDQEGSRAVAGAMASVARVAMGQAPLPGVARLDLPALRQALASCVPDIDAATAMLGYDLPFNPVAQALSRARQMETNIEQPVFRPECLNPALAPDWQQALDWAPPSKPVDIPESAALATGLGVLCFMADGRLRDMAMGYASGQPEGKQALAGALVEEMDQLHCSSHRRALASLAAKACQAPAPISTQWGIEFCSLVAESPRCTEKIRAAAIDGLSMNSRGIVGPRLTELARAMDWTPPAPPASMKMS